MRLLLLSVLTFASIQACSQQTNELSIFDGRRWGVVMEHPEMNQVVIRQDVTFLSDEKGTLKMDVYLPPGLSPNEKRPAVIFLNAIGDIPGEMKIKSWGTYRTWPQLAAANGLIGISMECDGTRIQKSLATIFSFIGTKGNSYNIDADKLGVYAASANVTQSLEYLMQPGAFPGIKAAVLYYGNQGHGPYRKDLPVLFVIAEGDVHGDGYSSLWNEVLKNKAPWTIKMGSGLIHAFDSFNDNDDSRKVIKETISFWKNNLEPMPVPSAPVSFGRKVLEAQYGHNNEKALELLKQYLNEHPNDGPALFQYASTLKNMQRYEEAEKEYRKVLSAEPDNVYALTYMYTLMHLLNRAGEADAFLSKALSTGQLNRNHFLGLGYSMYSMKKHKEGVKFFEKATEWSPTAIDFYNIACGYAILNEKDKAFSALNKSIAMGYNSREQFQQDTDLESLRADERYQDLLTKLK